MSAKKVTPVESGFSSPVVANDTESETSFAMQTIPSLKLWDSTRQFCVRKLGKEGPNLLTDCQVFVAVPKSSYIGKAGPITVKPG